MALEINGVNKVAFKGNEDQRSSGGMGVGVPIATTLIGGGIGYGLTRQPKEDEFKAMVKEDKVKLKEGELSADEQKAIAEAKAEIETAEKAGGTEGSTDANKAKDEPKKSDAKPEASTTEAPKGKSPKASVAAKGKTTKEIFGEAQELDPREFIQKKYGQSIENFAADTQDLKQIVHGHGEGQDFNKNRNVATAARKDFADGVEEGKKLLSQERRLKALQSQIDEEVAKKDKIEDKGSSQYRNAEQKIEKLERQQKEQTTAHERMKAEVTKKYGNNEGFKLVIETADDVKANTQFTDKSLENVTGHARKEITTKIKNDAAITAEKDFEELERQAKEKAKTAANQARQEIKDLDLEGKAKAASEKAIAATDAAKGADKKLTLAQNQLNKASEQVKNAKSEAEKQVASTAEDKAKTEVKRLQSLINKRQAALDTEKQAKELLEAKQKAATKKYEPKTEYDKADFIKKRQARAIAANQEKIDSHIATAKEKEINRRINAKIDEEITHSAKQKSIPLDTSLNKSEKAISTTNASYLERQQDWAMVRDARKNNKKVTIAQAEEVINTAAAKAKDGVTKLVKDVKKGNKVKAGETPKVDGEGIAKTLPKTAELFKNIGEKLAKVRTWKRGLAGAAIGLGAGIIIKLAFGGSKSEEA